MQRRGFLGLLGALIAGPSIAAMPQLDFVASPVIVKPENVIPTGYVDIMNMNRLMLVHSVSKLHTEHGAPIGNWVMVNKDDPTKFNVIGKSLKATPLSWKLLAINYNTKKALHYLEPDDAEFKRIVKLSQVNRGPESPGWGYGYGAELSLGIGNEIVTYPCVSKTTRKLILDILNEGAMNEEINLSIDEVKTSRFSFFAPLLNRVKLEVDNLPLPMYDDFLKG